MEYKELRTEFNRPSFKSILTDNLGCKCANCGSEAGIQYHHIVPLALGGTNKLSNIVPLCYGCHKAAHNGQHMQRYRKKGDNEGRPKSCSDEIAFKAFDDWATCKIGTMECKVRMGLSEKTHLTDRPQFKAYKASRGIIENKNNIDIIRKKNGGKLPNNSHLGYIVYDDGRRELF